MLDIEKIDLSKYQYELTRHCYNNSKAKYCPRINILCGNHMVDRTTESVSAFVEALIEKLKNLNATAYDEDHEIDFREHSYVISMPSSALKIEIINNRESGYQWPPAEEGEAMALLQLLSKEVASFEKEYLEED